MHDAVCILLDVIPFDPYYTSQRKTTEAVLYDGLISKPHHPADACFPTILWP